MISVLYVDDEPALLELGKVFLERNGQFTVDTVSSGFEAIEAIRNHRYDAIISDYQMPGMDGIELLKQVRASGNTVPLIIFTGRGREEVVIQALNEGADFYIQKGGEPVSQFAELAHKIQKAVLERQAEARIRDHERRETDIINFLPDATFAVDTKGVVIAWNRAMEKMTGVPAGEILGKDDYEYALPFYRTRRPILIDLILDERSPARQKYPYIRQDGKMLYSEITIPHFNDGKGAVLWFTASPLYNTQGEVVGAIESIREITEWKRTEEALNESEKRFRDLADLLPQIVYEADLDGNLTYVNRIAFEMFRFPSGQVPVGMNIFSFIVPEDRERARHAFRHVASGGTHLDGGIEFMARRMDGTTFPLIIYSSPVHRNGEATGLRGIAIDITERKVAEERVRESEQNYRFLFENATQGILVAQEQYLVHVNPAFVSMMGRPVADLLSRPFTDFIHPEDCEMVLSRHVKRMQGEEPETGYAFRVITGDGRQRWLWLNSTRVTWSGKNATLSFLTDITERKGAEDRLIDANKEYTDLLDQIQDVYYRSDMEGRLTKASRSWAVLLGYDTTDECIGRNIAADFYQDPEDRKKFLDDISQNGKVTNYEVRLRKRDGTPVLVETSSHIQYGPDGSVTGIEGIFRDITERKHQEMILQAQLALGLALQRVHGMHHTLEVCLDTAIGISGMDSGGIYLVDEATGRIDLSLSRNLREVFVQECLSYPPESENAAILAAGKPIYISYPDIAIPHSPGQVAEGLHALAILPITAGGKTIACMNISSHTREDIPPAARIALETVATQIGAAIERIRAEEALAGSEQKYRNVVEDQTEFISRFLPDGTHIFVNEAYCRYFGLVREEILGHRFSPDIVPEDRERVREFFRSLTPDHPVDTIEHRIVMPDGSIRWQRWSDRAIFDQKGNLVEYQSVGRDVTANKKTEEALKERERQFRMLVENSQDVVTRQRPDGMLTYISPASSVMYGYDPDVFLSCNIRDLIHPDDLPVTAANWRALTPANPTATVTYRVRHRDGRYIWVETRFSGLFDENSGELQEVFGITRDISESKRVEEKLRESQERFRRIFEDSPLGMAVVSPDFRFRMVNRRFCEMLGYSEEEMLEKTFRDVTHPDHVDKDTAETRRVFAGERESYRTEKKYVKKDGTFLWGSLTVSPVKKTAGSVLYVIALIEDISDRKEAENKLITANEEHQSLLDNIQDVYYRSDDQGRLITLSRSFPGMFGYDNREEALGKEIAENLYVDPSERSVILDEIRRNGRITGREVRLKRKDGSVAVISANSHFWYRPDGTIGGVEGTFRDISVQKVMTEALRESEERLRTITETTRDWIWETGPDMRVTYSNPAVESILGYRLDHREVSDVISIIHPDDRAMVNELFLSGMREKKGWRNVVIRWRHRDGSYRHLESTALPITGPDGEVTGFRGMERDITGQVLAEQALRRKTDELDYRNKVMTTLLETVQIGIFMVEVPSGKPIIANREAARLLGRGVLPDATEENLSEVYKAYRAGTQNRYPTDEMPIIRGMYGENKHVDDMEVVRPDGTRVRLEVFGTPVRDNDGRVVASLVSFIDITERKKAEDLVRSLAQFPAENPNPVIRVAIRGALIYANGPGTNWLSSMLEGPQKEVPESVRDLVAGMTRDGMSRFVEMKGPSGRIYEVTAVRPPGEAYVTMYVNDITERRLAEGAILEASKKINLLTSITRHDVANQVMALRGFAHLALAAEPAPEVADLVSRIDTAGATIARQIEFTRTYQELGVHAPVWSGIRELVGQQKPAGILVSCSCEAEVFADPMLEKVFFNLFDNAVRHGGNVREVSVRCVRDGNDLVITVEDNGVGIPAERKEDIFQKGYGENTGFGLFLTREILGITGITIVETGTPGKGARFEIRVPDRIWRVPGRRGMV
jgi:PAS domain S-box-containing protein